MSSQPTIKIKKNYPDAIVPVRQHETDSGLDLYAYQFVKIISDDEKALKGDELKSRRGSTEKAIILHSGERILVDTGVSATVGPGYEIQIRPRSGLALKQGLTVLNTPGTIDESYRGMIGVILINHSSKPQEIKTGDRIAQMIACPVLLSKIEIVENLDETQRGAGGFGHTGT
jgi:dUTP pyrophosphatase